MLKTSRVLRTSSTTAILGLAAIAIGAHHPVGAQQPGRTVADGIYTDAQATRGAASYDTACARCHRNDLGGADGPELKDSRFDRVFAGKPLKGLYERIASTMPRPAPASLSEAVYVDILAYVLRENGFPAGPDELNVDAIDVVQVLPTRPKPLPPVGDFAYVDVVGCLTEGPDGAWMLSGASDPVAVRPAAARRSEGRSTPAPRGAHTIHLIDAIAYAPEQHRGQLWSVRGTLIRQAKQLRLAISATETLSSTCP